MDEFRMYKAPTLGMTPGGSSGTYHHNQSPQMSFKSPHGNFESPQNPHVGNENLFAGKKDNEVKIQPSFLDQLVESANTDLKHSSVEVK